MDLLTIYLIIMLPSFGKALGAIFCLGWIIGFVLYSMALMDDCPWRDKRSLKWVTIPLIAWFITLGIPNNKQMQYLIGGYAITNVENIDKLPKNIVNAANKFLEDYQPDKSKE